jgi:predicted ATP-dependent Lon-type protease
VSGGAWGTLAIEYDSRYELKGRIYPFFIREFRPFQITRLDLDDYVEKRRRNYQTHVAAHVDFGKMTGRNQDALKKTTAGLFKLVFPHRTADDLEPDELQPCLSLATECRQRVLDQLAVMLPEEFGGTKVEVQMQG